jgi:hypothetical protein
MSHKPRELQLVDGGELPAKDTPYEVSITDPDATEVDFVVFSHYLCYPFYLRSDTVEDSVIKEPTTFKVRVIRQSEAKVLADGTIESTP